MYKNKYCYPWDDITNTKYDTLNLSDQGLNYHRLKPWINILNQNSHIKHLNLYRNNLGNLTMPLIAQLEHVEDIDLCYNDITNDNILEFIDFLKVKPMRNLKRLDISRCDKFSSEIIEILRDYLANNCQIITERHN